jgi:hypothetical protein
MGSISARSGSDPGKARAKTSGARNFPRRVAGLIAGMLFKSRKTGLKTSENGGIRGQKRREQGAANSE